MTLTSSSTIKYILAFLFVFSISLSTQAATEKYRLMFNTDPSTEVTIAWNQLSGSGETVYYGPDDFGTTWASYPFTQTPYRTTSFKGMTNKFAILTGLTPDTEYYFVIVDSEGNSDRYWFKTAPNVNTETLSIVAGGDSRSGTTQRQNSNIMVSKIRPHAVFFGGDLMNTPDVSSTQQWLDDWQLATSTDGQMYPLVLAYGNHEAYSGDGLTYLYDLFDTPPDGYFSVTFGGDLLSLYTLNSEVMPGATESDAGIRSDQADWLAAELAADGAIWKTAQYHRPMVAHHSSKSDQDEAYDDWAMEFYDNGVRVVFESDAHVAKITEEVRPTGSSSGSGDGLVYHYWD